MFLERIKRLPFIVSLYRLVHIGKDGCLICGLPWSNCKKHVFRLNDGNGFHPICKYCWSHCSLEEAEQSCTDLYEIWESKGFIPPTTLYDMTKAVMFEYFYTHKEDVYTILKQKYGF